MAALTTEERKRLPKHDFALPGGRYPIPDENHARDALSRVAQYGTPEEKRKVRAAVHRKFPNIGKEHEEAAAEIVKRLDTARERGR